MKNYSKQKSGRLAAKPHRGQPHLGKPNLGKPNLLILGCGDVGMRLLPLLRGRFRVLAVTRDAANAGALRAAGAIPVLADLDQPATLRRLAGLAHTVIHLAPPPGTGE
jgi:nucleoside-diphosphate-sugar epimerase